MQIEILCSFSDNPNQLVKDGLVFSLLGIESPKAIETLIKLSTDKSNDVRNWATFGIGSSIDSDNENIREALLKRTNDKHGETRHEAIIGLAMRGDSRVVEIIKQELIGGEFGYLLFAAILETKDKEFLPLLQQNLRAVEGDTSINPEWIRDLKKCIDELTKLTNET
ncbi:hypothetical protein SDC9_174245 [bioreactor metagenome]|uniref:HEAT repeat domain-containing protein n=1 Tax=bioreactor metagenome TaxID=1076179 RepID=A0A645GKZ7_9ZZZZ